METKDTTFRASGCFQLFSGSETEVFKKYIIKSYREQKFKRYKEIDTKYMKKGRKGEEDAITELSLFNKKMFKKNTTRLSNGIITGEPDVYVGDTITSATEGYDTKVSWELDTFPTPSQKLSKQYTWQNIAYMYLTGAKKWTTSYVLLDMPTDMLMDMLYRESFNWANNETPTWRELQIINNYVYSKELFDEVVNIRGLVANCDRSSKIIHEFVDIPLNDRIKNYEVLRDENDFEKLNQRVFEARRVLSKIY
jgi:hypothetical protein